MLANGIEPATDFCEAASELNQESAMRKPRVSPGSSRKESERVHLSVEGKGGSGEVSHLLVPMWAECGRLLHDLNNALVAILLNAQVIEWKLPSYSRIKRNVHEVERSAQRGGVLVRRLLTMVSEGTEIDEARVNREMEN